MEQVSFERESVKDARAYAELLIGAGHPAPGQRRRSERRTPYTDTLAFWMSVSIQHCVKTAALKLELDYLQNKLNNIRTTGYYNNNALQRNIVIMNCIVRDNQVMNDQLV